VCAVAATGAGMHAGPSRLLLLVDLAVTPPLAHPLQVRLRLRGKQVATSAAVDPSGDDATVVRRRTIDAPSPRPRLNAAGNRESKGCFDPPCKRARPHPAHAGGAAHDVWMYG
jgi:hypothetical protein